MSTRVILYTGKQFLISVAQVEKMYTSTSTLNKMKTGTVAYPRGVQEKHTAEQGKIGMGFELRSVFVTCAMHELLTPIFSPLGTFHFHIQELRVHPRQSTT